MGVLDHVIKAVVAGVVMETAGNVIASTTNKIEEARQDRMLDEQVLSGQENRILLKRDEIEAHLNEDVQAAAKALLGMGFNDILIEPHKDLITGWTISDGAVEEIRINGRSSFKRKNIFSANSRIVLRYHTFRNSDAQMEAYQLPHATEKKKEPAAAQEREERIPVPPPESIAQTPPKTDRTGFVKKRCRDCGTETTTNSKVCFCCGSPYEQERRPEALPSKSRDSREETPKPKKPVARPAALKCPNCTADLILPRVSPYVQCEYCDSQFMFDDNQNLVSTVIPGRPGDSLKKALKEMPENVKKTTDYLRERPWLCRILAFLGCIVVSCLLFGGMNGGTLVFGVVLAAVLQKLWQEIQDRGIGNMSFRERIRQWLKKR